MIEPVFANGTNGSKNIAPFEKGQKLIQYNFLASF
jgi:hypothetical protein